MADEPTAKIPAQFLRGRISPREFNVDSCACYGITEEIASGGIEFRIIKCAYCQLRAELERAAQERAEAEILFFHRGTRIDELESQLAERDMRLNSLLPVEQLVVQRDDARRERDAAVAARDEAQAVQATLTRERDEARAKLAEAERDSRELRALWHVSLEPSEGHIFDFRPESADLLGSLQTQARLSIELHSALRTMTARAEKAERKLLDTDTALQSLTPGGSEYVGDPQRCVEFVRSARQAERNTTENFARRAEEAERKLADIEEWRKNAYVDEREESAMQDARKSDRISSLESQLSRLRDGLREADFDLRGIEGWLGSAYSVPTWQRTVRERREAIRHLLAETEVTNG